jgi:hypothetical protein
MAPDERKLFSAADETRIYVAERRRKLASHIVAGFIAANHLRPEKTLETPMNYPLSLQDNSHFRSRTRHDAPG